MLHNSVSSMQQLILLLAQTLSCLLLWSSWLQLVNCTLVDQEGCKPLYVQKIEQVVPDAEEKDIRKARKSITACLQASEKAALLRHSSAS